MGSVKATRKVRAGSQRSIKNLRYWVGLTEATTFASIIAWYAGADADQVRAAAKELVDLVPDVLLAYAPPAVVALQRETRSIPIVFTQVSNPVGAGFVATMARPGGNITGFTSFESSIAGNGWRR